MTPISPFAEGILEHCHGRRQYNGSRPGRQRLGGEKRRRKVFMGKHLRYDFYGRRGESGEMSKRSKIGCYSIPS